MIEYAMVTAVLSLMLLVKVSNPIGGQEAANGVGSVANPTGNAKTTTIGVLMEAYQVYNDSYYFALCAPLP